MDGRGERPNYHQRHFMDMKPTGKHVSPSGHLDSLVTMRPVPADKDFQFRVHLGRGVEDQALANVDEVIALAGAVESTGNPVNAEQLRLCVEAAWLASSI